MAAAPASDPWAQNIQCRYYVHGICQRGGQCQYSHDLNATPNTVCRYYLQGSCTYGKQCRYDHIKPKGPTPTTSQSGGQPRQNPKASSSAAKASSSAAKASNSAAKASSSATKASGSAPKPGGSAPKPLILQRNGDCSGAARQMVTLKKQGAQSSAEAGAESSALKSPKPEEWVKAAEFVPGQIWRGTEPTSYLEAAQTGVESLAVTEEQIQESAYHQALTDSEKAKELCPFALHGECRFGENCLYLHGDLCEYCGRASLHPTDTELRTQHTSECIKQHEKDMELSFAIARSTDKTCGICMEVVMEKTNSSEQRFGLLSNCNHVFCLSCIRKWRAAKQFENKIVRSCPECRVKSDFVTPSKYWVEERADKELLIEGYKDALRNKPCKYFDQGRGECPFNNNCFYMHAYPDGRPASPRPVRRRPRHNADGQLDFMQQIILWDFLEEHRRRLTLEFDLEDSLEELLMSAGLWDTDSDDSDYSEYS